MAGTADISPTDPLRWAIALGRALAGVHATGLERVGVFESVFERPGGSRAKLAGPAAAVVSAGWERLTSAPTVLTHYDFWSGNVLWQSDVVSGVVDWSGAALGPRGFDVGWCRLDLYLLFDEHVGDAFLASYEATTGCAVPDRLLCELWAVARSNKDVEAWVDNYRALRRLDLTATELRRRHTAWTEHLLNSR